MQEKKKTNLIVSTNTELSTEKVSDEIKFSFKVDNSTMGWPIKKLTIKYEN